MSQYVFTDSQDVKELERLRLIEQVFDPASRRRIQSTGIKTDWRCLEVGAGAGSIAQWMAKVIDESGKVVAVDLNTRFMANIQDPKVEVLEADIRHLPWENRFFDLIHARYLLVHIPDFEVVLSKMLDLLKPGGWIVIEEPDFSAARAIAGEERVCESMNRMNRAIFQMFTRSNMDYALGIKLPTIFQNLGLQRLSVENDVPLANGGSGIATIMKMSSVQLAEKYIATGEATQEDIELYCQFCDDPNAWAIYYGTVGVTAQKSP